MTLRIEIERQEDGRWIGEVPDLPGVFAYGDSRGAVIKRVKGLSLRVLADRLERGEDIPFIGDVFTVGPQQAAAPQQVAVSDTDTTDHKRNQ
jgi:predicted RNase H-like HicB family nuclease